MRYYIAILIFFNTFFSYAQTVQSPTDFSECNFNAIAHRGYSEFYPENTLIAIEEAFKRGIKFCEIDIAITSDNKYVLHHDPYTIARTTNGSGTISENTLANLGFLDAGFWKSSEFKDTKLPTLVQALNLAQQYDAFLYLDIKEFDAELLANSLAESNADPIRMLPAIRSTEMAIEFRSHCPNSFWVWFGATPENVVDDNWYKEKIDLGCKYFELSAYEIFEDLEWFDQFRDKVHQNNAKVWAYTINNEEIIATLVDRGIDGVETDRPYVAQLKSCGNNYFSLYPKNETTGNWNFDLSGMSSIGVGSNLRNLNSDAELLQEISYGSTSQMGISLIEEQEAMVAKIPKYNPENGLFAYDNFMMEDDGAVDYTYSVIMDIYIPSTYKGEYISLIQTSPDNKNDSDFFINPEGQLGTLGDYSGNFIFDSWQRVIFALNGNIIYKYLNGSLIGETTVYGSRWTAFNNMAYHGKHGILLFADDSNETAEIYLNALQLRNYTIDTEAAALLGKPKAAGIPMNSANLYSIGSDNVETELIDWEQQVIFIKPLECALSNNIIYNLQHSFGASTNIPKVGAFNFVNDYKEILITAQDGTTKTWTIILQDTNCLDVYPNDKTVSASSGTINFSVSSNVEWSVSDDVAWLTVKKSDSSIITVDYISNLTTSSRTANITIIGTGGLVEIVTVTQAKSEDSDDDGILDIIDACPDTPSGGAVDANGCVLLAANNFTIEVISETCPNKNNGQLIISANESRDYKLTINGEKQSFTTEKTLRELSPGTYEICIEVEGVTSSYCYVVGVEGGTTISGKSILNSKQLQIEVLDGTLPYKVFVNGNLRFETYDNVFSLDIDHGDTIEVKTSFECEGVYSKKVQLFDNLTVYPNPSEGLFTIALPTNDKQAVVKVFNDISQLMVSNTYEVINSRIQLDLTDKPVGVYLVKVYLDKEYVFKVVKK